jgi:hypothetical protein
MCFRRKQNKFFGNKMCLKGTKVYEYFCNCFTWNQIVWCMFDMFEAIIWYVRSYHLICSKLSLYMCYHFIHFVRSFTWNHLICWKLSFDMFEPITLSTLFEAHVNYRGKWPYWFRWKKHTEATLLSIEALLWCFWSKYLLHKTLIYV